MSEGIEVLYTFGTLRDIAKIWDQLDTMEQVTLATRLAGTRRRAVFCSVIEQLKDVDISDNICAYSADVIRSAIARAENWPDDWVDVKDVCEVFVRETNFNAQELDDFLDEM